MKNFKIIYCDPLSLMLCSLYRDGGEIRVASCKFEGGKCKGPSDAKAHMRHNDISPDRRAVASKKNKHIDPSRSKYNFSILGLTYEQCAAKYDARIAYLDSHGNTNKRKDRVTMQIIEIPVPAGLPREQYRPWFFKIAELLRDKYGEENFLDGAVHLDEEHEYRDPETKEKHWSRVHGHYMIIPAVDGKLNGKSISLRKNMKALNREVDDMTQKEFGCAFMTGKKTKSVKTVEELKQESEYAELFYQLEQQKKELDDFNDKLRSQQVALAKKLEDIRAREEKTARLQEQAAEQYRALEQRGKEADAGLKLLKETLRECEGLRDAYRRAAERLKDMKTEIPQEELTESLAQGLKKVFSGFSIRDGGTLWEHTEKSVMDSIHAAVKDVQGRMPGAVFEEERDSIRRGEESVAGAVRHLKARELPLDEETYRKWSGRYAEEGMRMGL